MDKELADVLFYFVPAILAIGAMFLMVKKFLDRDKEIHMMDLRKSMHKEGLPLKLQAIERMVLFMERISPDNVLPRIHHGGISAAQLHSNLLVTIRTEFEHNMSQQVYLSDHAWDAVKDARDQLTIIFNTALNEVGAQSPGVHLSSKIFDIMIKSEHFPHQEAINELKKEARKLIG